MVISVSGGGDPEHTLVMCVYVTLMARDTGSINSGGRDEPGLNMTELTLIGKTHTWTHSLTGDSPGLPQQTGTV